ncbi:hypothetical protein [Ornithinimicrobium kibberense]|uniref:hypothetical protein n=1 Tax=Ornithinimicrobium kibberense TaxID=282060 RepID=UPI0015E864CB|nr:hypothetical protein [Ornithinimicrobium kibberense]
MTSQQTGGLKPTRRTLVKGAAWSVPVVAMGSTVAAANVACSPLSCPCITAIPDLDACRCTGSVRGFTYFIDLCFKSDCSTDVTITVTSVQSENRVLWQGETDVLIPAGGSACFPIREFNSDNSAQRIYVYFSIGDQPVADPLTYNAPNQTECPDCAGVESSAQEDSHSVESPEDTTVVDPAPATGGSDETQSNEQAEGGTTDASTGTTEGGTTDASTGTTEGGTTENG